MAMPQIPKPMDVDWQQLEEMLFQLTATDLREFAIEHPDEMFYGFAFDCNAEYGEAFLCFNTQAGLRRRAEEYKSPRFNYGPDKTIEQVEDDLRWSLGDWEYHIVNSEQFTSSWACFQEAIANICIYNDDIDCDTKAMVAEQFLCSVCRVAIRLQESSLFNILTCSDEFQVFVIAHHESEEYGWKRLERTRDTLSPPD